MQLLQGGEVAQLVEPLARSPYPSVRAAAAEALARVLLAPEVLSATAGSRSLSSSAADFWELLADLLLDDAPAVVTAALASNAALLAAAEAADAALPQGYLLLQLASTTAVSIAGALGPVLDNCSRLPLTAQLPLCRLLLQLVRRLKECSATAGTTTSSSVGGGGLSLQLSAEQGGSSGALQPPPLTVVAPAVCSVLVPLLASTDAAVCLEAAISLIGIVGLLRYIGGVDSQPQRGGHWPSASLPSSLAATAAAALLELRSRSLVEPALPDLVSTLVASVSVLEPAEASQTLQQLLPLVPRLPSMQERLETYCAAWQAWLRQWLASKDIQQPAAPGSLAAVLQCSHVSELLHPAAAHRLGGSGGALASPSPAPSSLRKSVSARAGSFLGVGPRANSVRQSFNRSASSAAAADAAAAAAQVQAASALPPTLRHELACSLLEIIGTDDVASLAGELCTRLGEQQQQQHAAAAHQPMFSALACVQHLQGRLPQVVQWACAAAVALKATAACLSWGQNDSQQGGGSASPLDSTTVAIDSWLQLLQLCTCTLSALDAVLRCPGQQLMGQAHGDAVEAVALHGQDLQGLMAEVMARWDGFGPAAKPRLLWALAHCYQLPAQQAEEAWDALIACLRDCLVYSQLRSEADVAGGAGMAGIVAEGLMSSGRAGAAGGASSSMPPTTFEQQLTATSVALCAAQRMALLLEGRLQASKQLSISSRTPLDSTSAMAHQLGGLLQSYASTSRAAGCPDIGEWCRRLLKSLTALVSSSSSSSTAQSDELAAAAPAQPAAAAAPVHAAAMALSYPFGEAQSPALQDSKRSRRQRTFLQLLHAAVIDVRCRASDATAGLSAVGSAAAPVPVLPAHSGMRLDRPSLWRSLPGEDESRWEQLAGPADPLALAARYSLLRSGRLHLQLAASCGALAEPLRGAEVRVLLSGPAAAVQRSSLTWRLPQLEQGESCSHSVELQLTGYGQVSVQCVVAAGSVEHHVRPLHISMARLLRPPRLHLGPSHFARLWTSLPHAVQLSSQCAAPGMHGQLVALSALLAGPFCNVSLALVPAPGVCHAAFIAETASGHPVALQLSTQLAYDRAAGSRGLVHLDVRTASLDVATTLQLHAEEWLQQLWEGALMAPGALSATAATATAPRGGAAGALHPALAVFYRHTVGTQPLPHAAAAKAPAGQASPLIAMLTPAAATTLAVASSTRQAAPRADMLDGGGGAGGADDSAQLVRNAALAEWRRLKGGPALATA